MSRWLQWSRQQPWGEAFVASQPVLGETGSLAANGLDSPAVGKVAAKAGTSVAVDLVTGRLYSKVQALGWVPHARRRPGAGPRTIDERRDI